MRRVGNTGLWSSEQVCRAGSALREIEVSWSRKDRCSSADPLGKWLPQTPALWIPSVKTRQW